MYVHPRIVPPCVFLQPFLQRLLPLVVDLGGCRPARQRTPPRIVNVRPLAHLAPRHVLLALQADLHPLRQRQIRIIRHWDVQRPRPLFHLPHFPRRPPPALLAAPRLDPPVTAPPLALPAPVRTCLAHPSPRRLLYRLPAHLTLGRPPHPILRPPLRLVARSRARLARPPCPRHWHPLSTYLTLLRSVRHPYPRSIREP